MTDEAQPAPVPLGEIGAEINLPGGVKFALVGTLPARFATQESRDRVVERLSPLLGAAVACVQTHVCAILVALSRRDVESANQLGDMAVTTLTTMAGFAEAAEQRVRQGLPVRPRVQAAASDQIPKADPEKNGRLRILEP